MGIVIVMHATQQRGRANFYFYFYFFRGYSWYRTNPISVQVI